MSCTDGITIVLCFALGVAFIIFTVKQLTWAVKKIISAFKKNKTDDSKEPTETENKDI